ncbi:ABC transporter ATP-binding protein [Oceanirhabdus sp. W0125-5]|uniref:ABC transporter ATP-binding protein n=1 Tax=Oceanirhabdus sp. W0125-5 TaxID=2999116 RepID=UPI0022F33FC4|nr:ABC transporter ATP-binding protein [Oceanirhabdus sp. W0125-5]WBW97743.1 ABC transporter ATP-binding protein [Oceanirhabdus sp. W0125-5]
MAVISFRNFTFNYHGLKSPTLKNINLEIKEGEKVLIAGPSGSGKSTLAHCINGLIPFSYKGKIQGELLIKGIKPHEHSIYEVSEYVGTILQDQDGQFVGLSVGEDVAFTFENNNVPQKEMFEGVNTALEAVDMLDYINETPHNLSGGQKQRVSMAGILASDADILLFDEPLANLDPASGKKAMEIIDEIHRKTNKTIIIIEHRIEDVLEQSIDRMVVMNSGEIIANGHPDKLLSSSIIKDSGLREPLYIEVLKMANVKLEEKDKISQIQNVEKYSLDIQDWYSTKGRRRELENKDTILKLENIAYKYFEDTPYIIDNINFDIKRGEILAILGNNGAGKSTLLKVISGIAKNQKGSIHYKGENIQQWTVRKRAEKIGYVMQNPNYMITQAKIFDEVAFGLRNFGVKESEIEERVFEALKICGLYSYRKWPVTALSYGQKKRLTIASILVMNPEIIILDEPTAGQDYKNYKEFMRFLEDIKEKGTSIVLITHDMHLAMEYADRAIVLSKGNIIAKDRVYNILSQNSIIEEANLKETSLTKIANICGIEDINSFIECFITEEKGGEVHE